MKKVRKNFVSAPKSDEETDSEQSDLGPDISEYTSATDESQMDVSEEADSSSSESEDEKVLNGTKRKATNDCDLPQKKRKSEKHLYKQPTVEEINQLRETENLFHSNLFRMQIKEMMKEIQIKEKYHHFVQSWLGKFNEFMSGLKSMKEREYNDSITFLSKTEVKNPLVIEEVTKKEFQFQFIKPNDKAIIVGSARNNALRGAPFVADICVFMPIKCFQKENYLNLVYDQKRSLYLMYIAHNMIKKKFEYDTLEFSYFENNPLKPVLEVKPSEAIGKKLTFRLFVVPEPNAFKLNRFVPWNSNIRSDLFESIDSNDENELFYATPHYNANVLFDLTMKSNQDFVNEYLPKNKNLLEGLILLKIWLRQCGIDAGSLGFGSHIMTMYVIYLFKTKRLNSAMSSYQVARNVWNNLALSCWNEDGKGISLCDKVTQPNQPTLEQFHSHYDVVFVDSTGFLNLCANLSLDIYFQLKNESRRAVELLDNKRINSFQLLFLTKIPTYIKFDHILKIHDENAIERILNSFGKKHDLHDFAGRWYPHAVRMISSVIRKGLGKRVRNTVPLVSENKTWSVTSNPESLKKYLKIGLALDSEHALEILDKGPQANEVGAEEFRAFWGDKSQLRRFQDGSITETCVWSASNALLTEKRVIVREIIFHLLYHHFRINKSEIQYIADNFDIVYKIDQSVSSDVQNAENASLRVIKSFNEVAKRIRAIDSIPLEVTSIQGISSVFRYCDPKPVLNKGKYAKSKGLFSAHELNEGVMQLGVSGKWPKDLNALRRIKTAFHIQIARSLRAKYNLQARGGIDGVYVLYEGYVYRLEIGHNKEIAALKQEISLSGVVSYKDTPQSVALEKKFVVMPKLTSILHGLYQRFPSFGPSVMIAKRWLYSQLIDNYLWPDQCTELLIAFQYLKIGATDNPCQPQVGFFRFLSLLANTDWKNEIFIVNFNDWMNDEEIVQLENEFSTDREKFPALCLISSCDSSKYGIWTRDAPTEHILARVKFLAKHTINVLESTILTEKPLSVKELFIPSLQGYDIIINLRPDVITSSHVYGLHPSRNITIRSSTVPPAGLDLVQECLKELRSAYSNYALFFNNPCGGEVIAVLFKPETRTEKEFKVASVNGCRITKKGRLIPNLAAFIEDFKIISNGLYTSIETNFKV